MLEVLRTDFARGKQVQVFYMTYFVALKQDELPTTGMSSTFSNI